MIYVGRLKTPKSGVENGKWCMLGNAIRESKCEVAKCLPRLVRFIKVVRRSHFERVRNGPECFGTQ